MSENMRWGAMLILAVCALGCHQNRKPAVAAPPPTTRPTQHASAALAFAPPVARNEPELQLWREGRELTAFGGYEQTITQYHYVRTDDRQNIWGNDDTFMRRALSVRFGVSTR